MESIGHSMKPQTTTYILTNCTRVSLFTLGPNPLMCTNILSNFSSQIAIDRYALGTTSLLVHLRTQQRASRIHGVLLCLDGQMLTHL